MTLLTLAEAKTALNIAGNTFDAELQDYIDGAIAAVEFICGPTSSTAVTEVVRAYGSIAVRCTPILTLTSVAGDIYGLIDSTTLRFDAYTGVIRPKATARQLPEDYYTVVFTTGRTTVPPALKQAAKVILKHQWGTQRGPSGRRKTGTDDPPGATNRTIVPGIAFAIPNAALQMMAPYDRGPAVG